MLINVMIIDHNSYVFFKFKMFEIVSSNPDPKISVVRALRHASSNQELEEIAPEKTSGLIIQTPDGSEPCEESIFQVTVEDQPVIKRFKAGSEFRLAVYNFSVNGQVPIIGFSIENPNDDKDLFVKGSEKILSPYKKGGLHSLAIATVPLLHVFNSEISSEAKRSSDLLSRASGETNISSLSEKRERQMMDEALAATHNVMHALHGTLSDAIEEKPKTGKEALQDSLSLTLDASARFYDLLLDNMRRLFEPSIRTMGEEIALRNIRT